MKTSSACLLRRDLSCCQLLLSAEKQFCVSLTSSTKCKHLLETSWGIPCRLPIGSGPQVKCLQNPVINPCTPKSHLIKNRYTVGYAHFTWGQKRHQIVPAGLDGKIEWRRIFEQHREIRICKRQLKLICCWHSRGNRLQFDEHQTWDSNGWL